MPPWHLSARHYSSRYTSFIGLILTVIGLTLLLLHNSPPTSPIHIPTTILRPLSWDPPPIPRIAKATILYSPTNSFHTSSLNLHSTHNTHFAYKLHTLHNPIIKGATNKLLYLHSLIIAELQKPAEDQVHWILYFDPSMLLSNAAIPLHIFLPPRTDDFETFKYVSFIGAKPDNVTLSVGVLWVRVSDTAVRILTMAMSAVYESAAAGQDGGSDVVSSALQGVLEQDVNRKTVLYQPAGWYNGTEAAPHALFTQPSSPDVSSMRNLLAMEDFLSAPPPDSSTLERASARLAREAEVFWATVAEARRVLNVAKEKGQTEDKGDLQGPVRETREWVEMRVWEVEDVGRRVAELKDGLGID